MNPSNWYLNARHVFSDILEKADSAFDRIDPRVVHICNHTNEFMSTKAHASKKPVSEINPSRNRTERGLQIGHTDYGDPTREAFIGRQSMSGLNGSKTECDQQDLLRGCRGV